MENDDNETVDGRIEELKKDLEIEKERKFVNLLIEIIVSITLRQLYEESD